MSKYLIYVHPSVPPANIKVNTWYSLEELQVRFDLDYIKAFFHPANFSFSELETTSTTKSITK